MTSTSAIDEILLAWPPPSSLNANLRPENGYELEFGMDWSFNSLFLNSRIFRQWMEDEIIYVPWSNRNLENPAVWVLNFPSIGR